MADEEPLSAVEETTEAEVDTLLEEFGGDARKAIGALLHDLKVLAEDSNRKVSKGYVRGVLWSVRKFG
jgi:Cdc6-like AAA superfamily ATPase